MFDSMCIAYVYVCVASVHHMRISRPINICFYYINHILIFQGRVIHIDLSSQELQIQPIPTPTTSITPSPLLTYNPPSAYSTTTYSHIPNQYNTIPYTTTPMYPNSISTGNVQQQPNIVVRWVDLTNVYLVHRTPADYMNNTSAKHSSKHTASTTTTNPNTTTTSSSSSSKGRKVDDDILSLLQKKKKTLPSSHGQVVTRGEGGDAGND